MPNFCRVYLCGGWSSGRVLQLICPRFNPCRRLGHTETLLESYFILCNKCTITARHLICCVGPHVTCLHRSDVKLSSMHPSLHHNTPCCIATCYMWPCFSCTKFYSNKKCTTIWDCNSHERPVSYCRRGFLAVLGPLHQSSPGAQIRILLSLLSYNDSRPLSQHPLKWL